MPGSAVGTPSPPGGGVPAGAPRWVGAAVAVMFAKGRSWYPGACVHRPGDPAGPRGAMVTTRPGKSNTPSTAVVIEP